MIFCATNTRQVGYLRRILRCFEVVFGLKVNLAKSEMFSVGEVASITSLADVLGCKVGALCLSYLGLHLGSKFKSKAIWNPVMEHIGVRLNSWKTSLLCKGRSLTLIKSTLASIPIYYLSLFTILASVAKEMGVNFRNFLWNDCMEDKKYHLVDWKVVCLCPFASWGPCY